MREVKVGEELFEGVVSFIHDEGWLQPVRLKTEEIPLHHEEFVARAAMSCGCRLRFSTTSGYVGLLVRPVADEERLFDLVVDNGEPRPARLAATAEQVVFDNLPSGRKTIEIWLPLHSQVRICGLLIDRDADFDGSPDARPRWVTYGSSITHCRQAHSPSRSWPAVAARLRDLNLTCLGYGGQCHMEPLVAMMIRDQPADFISLKVGINMVGGSVSQRLYWPLLAGMVRIIREKQPLTPVAVVSPIISPLREETPGATGMTLQMMRRELQMAVERLRVCGDENIYYFSGLDLFGADLVADYLPDLLHPNGDGYEIMGRNFAEKVIDRVLPR